ncbi:MAG: DUF2851 family protein [Calditrichaeota bacterium]|nr:DUF2851 family protein [Calditrichota bacterium]
MELKLHDQEIILQKLWKSKSLVNRKLETLTGKSVEVLYAGSANFDSGPDFKEAILKIGGIMLRGDIEVHLNSTGWYSHQHHHDAAYNKVILHLVSEHCENDFIEREDGVKVEQVLIEIDEGVKGSWRQHAELSSEKERNFEGIVEDCPLSREPGTKILATINKAGEERLHHKSEQFREDLLSCSWDQLIYKKIMESLGYSKNQQPFRKLADLVPFEIICAEMQWVSESMAAARCAALLFGVSGLLPTTRGQLEELDTTSRDYVAQLLELWGKMSRRLELKPMRAYDWQFFRLRPQNFPTRRIAGMVQLLSRVYKIGFLQGLLNTVQANRRDIRRLGRELESALVQDAGAFWQKRYRFETLIDKPGARSESILIGKDRARDMVVNIFIPALCLYSEEAQEGRLRNTILELYRRYSKLSDNSITKTMVRQLFNEAPRLKCALQQQGLIQLHKVYCRPLKCSECLGLA